jgi:hypothetical protein
VIDEFLSYFYWPQRLDVDENQFIAVMSSLHERTVAATYHGPLSHDFRWLFRIAKAGVFFGSAGGQL